MKNIQITFFINPYHFSYLHTLADSNQWANFQLWKQTLVSYLHQYQQNEITLWDFSVFSLFVNEQVPLEQPKQQMQWYWEPAHYRKELGDVMLNNMLVETKTQPFGIQLTTNSIENVTTQQQTDLNKNTAVWESFLRRLSK